MGLVDIGTEWNLKDSSMMYPCPSDTVDIGTEWNLKTGAKRTLESAIRVDIGTEWNLKDCGGNDWDGVCGC